jgi:Pacifastin inhibitor (LCMII)
MTTIRSLSVLLVTVGALAPWTMAGCGGRVDLPGGTASDGGTNDGADDSGHCTPGSSWKLDCNTCVCNAAGDAMCTTMACVDSGACPPTMPPYGSACSAGLVCTYPTSCGSAYAECKSSGWVITVPDCPIPPPTACPASPPTLGTWCSGDLKKACDYPNRCGGADSYSCSGRVWVNAGSSCSTGSCPALEPASGAACRLPAGTTCTYGSSGACPDTCSCGIDGQWQCYPAVECPPSDAGTWCSDGNACTPGAPSCIVPCIRSCDCGSDGTLHCTPLACGL